MEKESKHAPYLSPRSESALARCPVLNILRTTEFGMIVESNRPFEIGEEITIGFHVTNGSGDSSFISAESLVVGSERDMTHRKDFRHQVTLLFSNIASADRERLITLSKSMQQPSRPRTMGLN